MTPSIFGVAVKDSMPWNFLYIHILLQPCAYIHFKLQETMKNKTFHDPVCLFVQSSQFPLLCSDHCFPEEKTERAPCTCMLLQGQLGNKNS